MQETLRVVLMGEIVLLFALPIGAVILLRRRVATERPVALVFASVFGLAMATAALYFMEPATWRSLRAQDWLTALGIAGFLWLIAYPVSLWSMKIFRRLADKSRQR